MKYRIVEEMDEHGVPHNWIIETKVFRIFWIPGMLAYGSRESAEKMLSMLRGTKRVLIN